MGFSIELMFAELLDALENERYKGKAVTAREAALERMIYSNMRYACECNKGMKERIEEVRGNG